jgi:benzodiazapine receptor
VELDASRMPSPGRSAAGLIGLLALCFAVGGAGAAWAWYSLPQWYALLAKPRFTPPNWVFAPVWSVLDMLMAVAAWLVWRTPRRRGPRGSLQYIQDTQGSARIDALAVFLIQLSFNLLWALIFFHDHRLLVAAVVVLALWIAILATILLFWRVRPLAGVLMVPYLVWVSVATALNLALLRRN